MITSLASVGDGRLTTRVDCVHTNPACPKASSIELPTIGYLLSLSLTSPVVDGKRRLGSSRQQPPLARTATSRADCFFTGCESCLRRRMLTAYRPRTSFIGLRTPRAAHGRSIERQADFDESGRQLAQG